MAFLDSVFDPSSYAPSSRSREIDRLRAVNGLEGGDSDPIPGIAHGSIPGLLGVRLNDQMRAARASLDATGGDRGLSAPPTRTDAPANTPAVTPPHEMVRSLLGLGAAAAPPAPNDGAMMGARPPGLFGAGPAPTPAPAPQGGGPAPPLPPPISVGPPPGASAGSATPPPLPQSPAAMMPSQPATATAAAAMPQQDNSLIPRDSLLGRLFGGLNNWRDQNRLTLLAMAGGLAGAPSIGTGLSRAFTAAVPAQRADIAQNQQNQTAHALISRGVPRDIALAASTNPAILQQLLPQIMGAKQKQFTQIGEDMFGNKKYGFVDPVSGTVTEFGGSTPYGGGGGTSGTGAAGNVDSSLTGEAYLKQFPQEIQAAVKAYVAGESMPTGNPRAGFTQAVKQIAQKYGQDIGIPADDAAFSERRKMRTDIGSSSPNTMGGIISNGKSAFEHLANLSDKYVDLGNYNGPGIPGGAHLATVGNAAGNIVAPTSEQAAKIAAANDNALKYGQEATKFYAGSGGGEAERMAALHGVSPRTASSNEMAAFLQTEKELMLGRLKQKEDQIRGTLGQEYLNQHPVMTPDLQNTLKKIDGNIAKLKGEASPAASIFKPPANWQFSPSRQMYRDPSGKMYDVNGNPVP